MKLRPIHNCPDCIHALPTCPECDQIVDPKFELTHWEGSPDISDWCPRHPLVIEIKAMEKRRGDYDPSTWAPTKAELAARQEAEDSA